MTALLVVTAVLTIAQEAPFRLVYVSPAEAERQIASGRMFVSGGGIVAPGTRIAPFAAKDLQGREWTEKSLLGKTTLIAVWASWCKPCIEELPVVDQLHRLTKESAVIQVLSFHIDAERDAAVKVSGGKYELPVVFVGDEYVKKLVKSDSFGIPKFWIVIRRG